MKKKTKKLFLFLGLGIFFIIFGLGAFWIVLEQTALFVPSKNLTVGSGKNVSFAIPDSNYTINVSVSQVKTFRYCYDVNDWQDRFNGKICSMVKNGTDAFGCTIYKIGIAGTTCINNCRPNQGKCYCGASIGWRNPVPTCTKQSYQYKGGATFWSGGGYCAVSTKVVFNNQVVLQSNKSNLNYLLLNNGSYIDFLTTKDVLLDKNADVQYFIVKAVEENYWGTGSTLGGSQDKLEGAGCRYALVEVGKVVEPLNASVPEQNVSVTSNSSTGVISITEIDDISQLKSIIPVAEDLNVQSFTSLIQACGLFEGKVVGETCLLERLKDCEGFRRFVGNESAKCEQKNKGFIYSFIIIIKNPLTWIALVVIAILIFVFKRKKKRKR
jgi:hypothetical protein